MATKRGRRTQLMAAPVELQRRKRSTIVFESMSSRHRHSLLRDGSIGFFQDPSLALSKDGCCFVKLEDCDLCDLKERSLWLYGTYAEAKWTVDEEEYDTAIGLGLLTHLFLGCNAETVHNRAEEAFNLLHARENGEIEIPTLSLPKEYFLATGQSGYLLRQESKLVDDTFWTIEFLEGVSTPFKLEMHVTANSQRYSYPIDPLDLREILFDSTKFTKERFAVSPSGDLFGILVDGLVLDPEFDMMQVDVVEMKRMMRYSQAVLDAEKERQINNIFDVAEIERSMRDYVSTGIAVSNDDDEEEMEDAVSSLSPMNSTQHRPHCHVRSSIVKINTSDMSPVISTKTYRKRPLQSKKIKAHGSVQIPAEDPDMLRLRQDVIRANELEAAKLNMPTEDNVMPYEIKDNVESYLALELNKMAEKFVGEHNLEHNVRKEAYMRTIKVGTDELTILDSMRFGDSAVTNASFIHARDNEPSKGPLIMQLREALKTPPEKRLQAMHNMMTKGLSEYVSESTEDEMRALAYGCSVAHIANRAEILSHRDESIGKVLLRKKRRRDVGDQLDEKSSATDPDNRDCSFVNRKLGGGNGHTRSGSKYKVIEEIRSGSFVGSEFWRGRMKWKYDVVSGADDTVVCVIPIQCLTRFVGYVGAIPKDIMTCFWKYHGLLRHAQDLSRELSIEQGIDVDFSKEMTERAHIRCYWPGDRIFTEATPRRHLFIVTMGECAFTRSYPPRGTYTPANAALRGYGNLRPDSIEVNIGLNLFPGHFAFMDGFTDESFVLPDEATRDLENSRSAAYFDMLGGDSTKRDIPLSWRVKEMSTTSEYNPNACCEKWRDKILKGELSFGHGRRKSSATRKKVVSRSSTTALNRMPSLDENRPVHESAYSPSSRKKSSKGVKKDKEYEDDIFGHHINSLVAVTYCEVCVIPLEQVYHCPIIFNKLLQISRERYVETAMSIKDLLKKYQHSLEWEIRKKETINENCVRSEAEAQQAAVGRPISEIVKPRHTNDFKTKQTAQTLREHCLAQKYSFEQQKDKLMSAMKSTGFEFNYTSDDTTSASQTTSIMLTPKSVTPSISPFPSPKVASSKRDHDVHRPTSAPPSRKFFDGSPADRKRTFRTAL